MARRINAQSHIEMIISFSLFLGFLVLVFFSINPIFNRDSKTGQIDNIEKILLNNISTEIYRLSVVLNNETSCYDFLNFNLGIEPRYNYIEVRKDPRKYDIYFSDTFEKSSAGKKACSPLNYDLGAVKKEEVAVYERAAAIKQADYEGIKAELGINRDFSLNFRHINGSSIEGISIQRSIPKGREVDSKESIIVMINKEGKFNEVIMNTKIW